MNLMKRSSRALICHAISIEIEDECKREKSLVSYPLLYIFRSNMYSNYDKNTQDWKKCHY